MGLGLLESGVPASCDDGGPIGHASSCATVHAVIVDDNLELPEAVRRLLCAPKEPAAEPGGERQMGAVIVGAGGVQLGGDAPVFSSSKVATSISMLNSTFGSAK